jgi:prolipoprotein diacylglyceryl transferase
MDAFKIWNGGMGIWGAVALGTLVAWWQHERLRRRGRAGMLSFAAFTDAMAPGLLFAQAVGRLGNWFNGELFGRPTTLPWGLRIPLNLRPPGYEAYQTFQPTFLYEALWCIFIAIVLMLLERRFKPGQAFLFYVAAYCVGRLFVESLRIDTAHTIAGLRVNIWVSLIMALFASFLFLRAGRRRGMPASDW